jgi:hypothetical protein
MNAVAPATAMPLITCERGLGRLQASSCAKRWRIGNAAPGTLGATKAMDAASVRNSPCRACPHGSARAKAGEHNVAAPLVKLQDVSPVALRPPANERPKARPPVERPTAVVAKREPMPPAPNGHRCVICDAALFGRSLKACHGEHQAEYYRRSSLAVHYRRKGDEAAVAAVMRGELPSDGRGDAQKRKALHENVKSVETPPPSEPPKPLPPHVKAREAIDERLSEEPALQDAVAAEPAIGPFAYTVNVRGLPIRCRTLDDVIALVERFGGATPTR